MKRGTTSRIAALAALGCALICPALTPAAERDYLDVRLFTRIGSPGQPEPIAVGPPNRRVYVGTFNHGGRGDPDAPSKIFAYSPRGELVRSYTIRGQDLSADHGIHGLAFDGEGRLYALDHAPNARVIRLNPRTGRQRTWARFADVPPCSQTESDQCSAAFMDEGPAPNYPAFGPDGEMYVTDSDQALIWRIGPRGGKPRVWLTDPAWDNIFGPNGIGFLPDRRTLLMAVTFDGPSTAQPLTGSLYEIPVRADGGPGTASLFWRSSPLDAPDGFAIGRTGRIYLALAGYNSGVIVLSAEGEPLARIPPTILDNSDYQVPFDGPASVAFLGRRLLVTNHSPIGAYPGSWAVLDVWTGERGEPLIRP